MAKIKCLSCKSTEMAISKPYPLIPHVIRRDTICLRCGYGSHVDKTVTPDEYDSALIVYLDEINAIKKAMKESEK